MLIPAFVFMLYVRGNGSATSDRLFVTFVTGGLIGLGVHEIVHVFAYPSRQRLRWTALGFSPIVNYPVVRKISTPWTTVRKTQGAGEFVWAVIAPFVLLGLGGSLLAITFSNQLTGIFFAGLGGANVVGSRYDFLVLLQVIRCRAKTIRDEPDGFHWR